MKLEVKDNTLHINLNPLEKLLCFRGSVRVPIKNIARVSVQRPRWEWLQARVPGIHIPFFIKAGTYIGAHGREIWHATIGKPFLTLELKDWDYYRIVLTIGENLQWAETINRLVGQGPQDQSTSTA